MSISTYCGANVSLFGCIENKQLYEAGRVESSRQSPFKSAWRNDSATCGNRDWRKEGSPDRPAASPSLQLDGTVKMSVSYTPEDDNREVAAGHGDVANVVDQDSDLPPALQKPSDGSAENRSPKGGFSHGSKAATGWLKCDVPNDRAKRFNRLHDLQHDQMAVRDADSDTRKTDRREQLWLDLSTLGLDGYQRQRANRLVLTDEYRSSSWARHYHGFVGLAIGYASVVRFESEAAAKDAARDDGEFANVSTDLLGEMPEVIGVIRYAWERAEERGVE